MRLLSAIERYLRAKRNSGLRYETEASILWAFQRYVRDPLIGDISPREVLEFLNIRQCSTRRWTIKHSCLRMFFEFWSDRGHMPAISMPQRNNEGCDRTAAAHIYTRAELRRLLQMTCVAQANVLCGMSGATLRAVLLALYGTGAMTGEILRLRRTDLDLERNMVFLCGNGKIRPRRVPLNAALRKELSDYLHSKERRSAPSCSNVFVSKMGGPLQSRSASLSFARLRTLACVVCVGTHQNKPRMSDLRPTFAVHRIASWIKESADLNRMLPALSAYMGFSGICSTDRFLRITPERFQRELDELSPSNMREHWRNDPHLMDFLAGLQIQTGGN